MREGLCGGGGEGEATLSFRAEIRSGERGCHSVTPAPAFLQDGCRSWAWKQAKISDSIRHQRLERAMSEISGVVRSHQPTDGRNSAPNLMVGPSSRSTAAR